MALPHHIRQLLTTPGAPTIFVAGTRGIPDVQGGVERHCEELYKRVVGQGVRVVLFTRTPYIPGNRQAWSTWQGIVLRNLWAPHAKHAEAFVHTFLAVTLARWYGAAVIHLHSVGSGLVVPYARLLGLRVLMTHHGFDYNRQKWGRLARFALRLGERLGARHAHVLFGVSHEVCRHLATRYGRQAVYLPNGVAVPSPRNESDPSPGAGVPDERYILAVARLVPEKGLHTLLEACTGTVGLPMLAIVGDADHDSKYTRQLKSKASDRVQFLGRRPHQSILDLIGQADLLVLPSLHEGLPIALLEGLAAGTTVLASDIPVHREVLDEGRYGLLFHAGDAADLRAKLQQAISLDEETRQRMRLEAVAMVRDHFGWDAAVRTFLATYTGLLRSTSKRSCNRLESFYES